jgi:hypothetical protein
MTSAPTSSGPPHHHEPRLRPAVAEREVLQIGPDLEPRRHDTLHGPPLSKGDLNLLPGHPPWSLCPRLLGAEAEQEGPTAQLHDRRQPLDTAPPIIIVEDVEWAWQFLLVLKGPTATRSRPQPAASLCRLSPRHRRCPSPVRTAPSPASVRESAR